MNFRIHSFRASQGEESREVPKGRELVATGAAQRNPWIQYWKGFTAPKWAEDFCRHLRGCWNFDFSPRVSLCFARGYLPVTPSEFEIALTSLFSTGKVSRSEGASTLPKPAVGSPAGDENPQVPGFKSWRGVYIFVLAFFVAVVVLLTLFSRHYA